MYAGYQVADSKESDSLMARTKAVYASGTGAASTQATQAYERLREDLIGGRFAPGEKLRVQMLCDLYGIGISPIREALNRATRDGLVRQVDLRGFSVTPLTEADLAELTKTRCWLNEIALRQSIANGGQTWEEGIVLAHHRMQQMPRRLPDSKTLNPEWEIMHRAFHSSLLAACGSQRLIDYCEQLFDSATRYRLFWNNPGAESEKRSEKIHTQLMNLSLARQTEEAVALLNEHFQRAAGVARQHLICDARR
jgi:GntR family carbon starvation induced transcriptional regulator